jgi:hypothetical protein
MFKESLHEITACIYYKIAVNRGLRGCAPDAEHFAHSCTGFQFSPVALALLDTNEECLKTAAQNVHGLTDYELSQKVSCGPATDADIALAIK